jgi:hypothetical protein
MILFRFSVMQFTNCCYDSENCGAMIIEMIAYNKLCHIDEVRGEIFCYLQVLEDFSQVAPLLYRSDNTVSFEQLEKQLHCSLAKTLPVIRSYCAGISHRPVSTAAGFMSVAVVVLTLIRRILGLL